MDAVAIGVDFGTTNTVVAIAGKSGRVDVQRFETPGGLIEAYRSALLFFREGKLPNEKIAHLSGPTALERALDIESDHRYLQSLKTYLGSAAFEDTYLLGRRYLLEELIGLFLGDVLPLEMRDLPIVAGRPVVFAGDRANETLALERLTRAYRNAGAKRIDFAFEPSGAAYWYARDLTRAETVLVADFGGGTSDFSIMRFEPSADGLRSEPLSHAGIGIAGDTFDFRIVDQVVSPRLGKGSRYRSFGKLLPLPAHYHATFAQWHKLSLLKSPRTLGELRRLVKQSENPQAIEDLIRVVEDDLGYQLYLAVSEAKVRLSSAERTTFHFSAAGLDIEAEIARGEFEGWIESDVMAVGRTIDLALDRAGLEVNEVHAVFMTGGTSYVPAVRRLFEERFGSERLRYGDAFNSVASGLALIGADMARQQRRIAPS